MPVDILVNSRVLPLKQPCHLDKFLHGQLGVHADSRIKGIGIGYDESIGIRNEINVILSLILCNGHRAYVPQHALIHAHDNGGNGSPVQVVIVIHAFGNMEIKRIPIISLVPGGGRHQHARHSLYVTVRRDFPQIPIVIPKVLDGGTRARIIGNRLPIGTDHTDAPDAPDGFLRLLQPVVNGMESHLPALPIPVEQGVDIFNDFIIHIYLINQV